jgi:hypothetical protein
MIVKIAIADCRGSGGVSQATASNGILPMRESDFQQLETKDFLILAVIMGVFLCGCWFVGSLLVKAREPNAIHGTQQPIISSTRSPA